MKIRLLAFALCVFIVSGLSGALAVTLSDCDTLVCEEGLVVSTIGSGMCHTSGVCTGASMKYKKYYTFGGKTTCSCETTDNMYCADGFYGVPTSTDSGQCKKCPDHGECIAGYNSTWKCKTGYAIPAILTEPICVAQKITCSAGYYLSGDNVCIICPGTPYYCPGGTWTANDTDQGLESCPYYLTKHVSGNVFAHERGSSQKGVSVITKCYMPRAGGYEDETGTYGLTNNCYYSE